VNRREFLAVSGALALPLTLNRDAVPPGGQGETMYGLIGKVNALPGQRDGLAAILLEGTQSMPGCLSYVVAMDPGDVDALWITEVWDNAASHQASLKLPAVQAAIAKGRPLIAGFSNRVETVPLGGMGLGRAPR
jgi:quinol monooxygenase YgiN